MEPTKPKSSNLLRKIIFGFLGIALIALAVTILVFSFTYSEGSRAGVIIKFSKKGYVFKTYEGDLNLGGIGNIPNTAQLNQIWEFSVKNQQVADTLMGLEGRKVSLHYKEKIKNLPWQGETKYFVDGVEVLSE